MYFNVPWTSEAFVACAAQATTTTAQDYSKRMDGWDVFGPDDNVTVILPPSLPAKRVREGADTAALAPFLYADSSPIIVPPPPLPSQPLTEAERAAALSVWPEHPPEEIGPIALADCAGSGRGFVATRDIGIGEILMVEAPFVPWTDAERTPLALIRSVLIRNKQGAPLEQALSALRRLHPTSLDGVERLVELEAEYRPTIDALLPLWRTSVVTSGATETDRSELLRLCLATRWNAFDSGMFLHQAIFNHAPSRVANCDKAALVRGGRVVSVVRATRHVPAGAQCLICYLQPPEVSASSSTARLAHFDFSGDVRPRHDEWDCTADAAGASSAANSVTTSAEEEQDACIVRAEEGAVRSVRAAMRRRPLTDAVADARTALADAVRALGPRHLGVAGARREVLSALRGRLRAGGEGGGGGGGEAADTDALLLLLESALELWISQRDLLGACHPECAATLHDVGSALGALLACASQRLFARFPGLWDTPERASRGEQRALELHRAIAALYASAG